MRKGVRRFLKIILKNVRDIILFTPFNISNADYKLTETFVYILNIFAL
jgi:hypothetical protein